MHTEIQLSKGIVTFGMSITLGGFASNSGNYWVNRFAQFVGGGVEQRAVSGTGMPSMVARTNDYGTYGIARTKNALIDGPLNDIRQTGPACFDSIKPAYDAMLSNLFNGYFRGAAWGAPSVVKTGAWSSLGGSYGGRSTAFSGMSPMYTTDPSATIEFQFGGDIVALHGFASETGDWLDWEIEIDGVSHGATNWATMARPGAGKQCVAHIIEGLGAGTHVVKLSPPASGIPAGHACVFDGVQTPMMAAPVILGTVPNIGSWSALGSIGTLADAQHVNTIIAQVVAEWQLRGFPVGIADLVPFLDPSRDFGPDLVHLTDRGQLNWFIGYLSAIRVTP